MSKVRVVDFSGGDSHIREIAEESGVSYMGYFSHERTETVSGFTVQSWYDEDASSGLTAWGAFIKGVGTCTAESREEAVDAVVAKALARSQQTSSLLAPDPEAEGASAGVRA